MFGVYTDGGLSVSMGVCLLRDSEAGGLEPRRITGEYALHSFEWREQHLFPDLTCVVSEISWSVGNRGSQAPKPAVRLQHGHGR